MTSRGTRDNVKCVKGCETIRGKKNDNRKNIFGFFKVAMNGKAKTGIPS